jgi:LacI family gluconate utilization system Gnt-I transcriptional repressor
MAADGQAPDNPTFDDVVRVPRQALAYDDNVAPRAQGPRGALLEDVARLAGVAPITVSRAIRQPEKVGAERLARIRQAIAQTGYRTNSLASALKSGRSNIVLAFLSNIGGQQFALAMRGSAQVLEPAGYQFLIGQTSYSYRKETEIIKSLHSLRPAAVMFTGVIELEDNRERLRALGIPIVETWAYPRDPLDLLVGFSNTDAGWMAGEHLHARGYRRVAFLGRRGGRGALRLKGFRAACAVLGLALVCEVLCDEVESIADGGKLLMELLERSRDVDAAFCANDLLAIGALMEARHRKLAVPTDLAIIGFGENDMAAEMLPGLTMIGVDSFELGRRAGDLLLQRLRGVPMGTTRRHMALTLTQRGST